MAIPLNDGNLDEIVTAFQDAGIVILSDVDPGPLDMLTRMLSERSGLTPEQIQSAGHDGNVDITPEMRQRLTRGFMTPELMSTLYDTFGDLVVRLIGPIVHASQDFHYQVKRKSESGVILKGRSSDSKEVQALYGIHNELTAARVVTTPSAMVCWVPLNDYDGTAIYFSPLRPDAFWGERSGASHESCGRSTRYGGGGPPHHLQPWPRQNGRPSEEGPHRRTWSREALRPMAFDAALPPGGDARRDSRTGDGQEEPEE